MRLKHGLLRTSLLLFAAACGTDQPPASEAPTDTATAAPTAPAAVPDTAITVPFEPAGGMEASGSVRVEADGERTLLTVLLRAGSAGTWHGNIHEGGCAAPGGSIERLEAVVTDVTGAGEALTAVDLPITALLNGAHSVIFVDAHGAPSVCADLPSL